MMADFHCSVLGENPLWCDCNLKWLADWIKLDLRENGVAKCTGPESLRHKLLLTTPSSWFQCAEGYDASHILSKCDACRSNPCGSNGDCVSLGFESFECKCRLGFHGKTCQSQIDACFGDPCQNEGKCSALNGRFECECQPGFTGRTCEVNINDCERHQCKNGATCVDRVQDYQCECAYGYRGRYCEVSLNLCEELSPCKNGAECITLSQDYQCRCPTGFSGKQCATNIDDCVNNICQNGAHCIDGIGEYSCECPVGFTGKYCATRAQVVPKYLRSSVCQNSDCQNGGVCFQPPSSNEYQCKCPSGYEGKKCEKLPSVSFLKDSYIKAPGLDFSESVNITITFTSEQHSGVIIHQGADSHLAAELYQGRVRISFSPEDSVFSGLLLYSYGYVNDGKPHTLSLIVNRKQLLMTVDNASPRQIVSSGSSEFVNSISSLFLGGLPSEDLLRARSQFHVTSRSSFNGCFHSVYIDGKRFDFSGKNLISNQVLPGCGDQALSDSDNVCRNNLCVHGKCQPLTGNKDYECKCNSGYTGEVCDQPAVKCAAVTYRDYYTDPETGCKSRNKVKLRRCEGDDSCAVRRIRTKTVKVRCKDNSTYKKVIEIPRKCSRSKRRRIREA